MNEYRVRVDCDDQGPVAHVVDLGPYRDRRRTRGFAFGLLLGYLAGAWLLPALADLAGWMLDDDAGLIAVDRNGTAERVQPYTE